MTIIQRQDIISGIFSQVKDMAISKGKDYSSKEDSLANFKRNAERLGLTKYQVWLVYFNKHIDAINNSIRYNPDAPEVSSEPLEERIIDAITYLTLFKCLLEEDKTSTGVLILNIEGNEGSKD